MKCLNCDAEAVFKVLNDASDDQFYCEADLPPFLTERAFASRVVTLSEIIKNSDSPAAFKGTKKKKEEVVEPTPVAEPVVEVVAEEKAAE